MTYLCHMEREIVVTADGSKTIYIKEWNEHYHSTHGALQEAQHVFLQHGLYTKSDDYLTVLEMGFGTGLNALLTYFASEKRNQYIHYIGVEAFPPSKEELEAMEYDQFTTNPEANDIYNALHAAAYNKTTSLSEHFVLEKIQQTFEEFIPKQESIDLIFYDAFGPRVQPHLWTIERFAPLYAALVKGGILVTYCAKGQVKRDLKSLGFMVETLPGPPGKREMIRATK